MDMVENGTTIDLMKGSEDAVQYHASSMSSDWHVVGNNMTNTSTGMTALGNSMVESSACSSGPTVEAFCPPIWEQPFNGRSLGHCDMYVHNYASISTSLGPVRAGVGWTPNTTLREGMFLPNFPGMLPYGLPHFPVDSAFLERAARFCCLDGGNFSEMASPYTIPHPLNPHSPDLRPMQGQHAVFECNESEWVPGMELQGHEMSRTEVFDEASLSGMHGNEGSPFKDEKKSERFMRSHDEAEIGIDVSCKQSDKAESCRIGAQEELDGTAGESFGKGPGLKKRKIAEQRTGHNENNEAPQASAEAANDTAEISPSGDQKPSLTNNHGGKHGKLGSQGPEEEYIHVRARRGQATNSHSLAERVRREKISERMKLLQDLVPGCSQVTGKAVMLDEIINYVQSLQRQVEFLSMKLATVNPSVDFNMEGFLAKDILKPGGGLSPSLAFPPDTVLFPPLHPPQPGLIRACLPGTVNSPDTFQRPISLPSITPCGGARQTSSQAPSVWEDELHNVVHSGFNASAPPDSQDLSGIFDSFSSTFIYWPKDHKLNPC